MEKMGDLEQMNLVNELTQGREFAKQLKICMNTFSSSSSSSSSSLKVEKESVLVQKILASYRKTLSMLNYPTLKDQTHNNKVGMMIGTSESPHSINESPRSEDSDREFRDFDSSRKRRVLLKRKEEIRVPFGIGLESCLDDGFSWRKYGQKDILGAKFPRGYYRCTYRNVQDCLATKQVQKSNDDPTVYDITYRGTHTCNQTPNPSPPPPHSPTLPPPETLEPNIAVVDNHLQIQSQEFFTNLREGIKVTITEDLEVVEKPQFPSGYLPIVVPSKQNDVIVSPPIQRESFTSDFVSPSNQESGVDVFPSPIGNSGRNLQGNMNFGSSGNELGEILSAATVLNRDFSFSGLDFDSNFTFDNRGFFS